MHKDGIVEPLIVSLKTVSNTTNRSWQPQITDGSSVGKIAGIVDMGQRGDNLSVGSGYGNHYYAPTPWYPWHPYTPWYQPITVTPLADYETRRAAQEAERAAKEIKDEVAALKATVEQLSTKSGELTNRERAALDLLLGVNTGDPAEYARVLTAVKILLGV